MRRGRRGRSSSSGCARPRGSPPRWGSRCNAGHGLNYHNVEPSRRIAGIVELNIGHAIVARAVFDGLPKAVGDMKDLMRAARA